MPHIRPRALFGSVLVVVLILVAAFVLVRRQTCHSASETRDDQRVMWLYALEQNPTPEDERALAFRVELDRRIPELACSWAGTQHPVEAP